MPSCRREQTTFALFLVVVVSVEVICIIALMHMEHRKVARRSRDFQQELLVAAPRRLRLSERDSARFVLPPPAMGDEDKEDQDDMRLPSLTHAPGHVNWGDSDSVVKAARAEVVITGEGRKDENRLHKSEVRSASGRDSRGVLLKDLQRFHRD